MVHSENNQAQYGESERLKARPSLATSDGIFVDIGITSIAEK
jgi:hypothetical protein